MSTLDLFQDHSTEQAAARGGNCGAVDAGDRDRRPPVSEAVTEPSAVQGKGPVRGAEALPPAGAGPEESAPQVPGCTGSGTAYPLAIPAAQTCGSCGRSSRWLVGGGEHDTGMVNCTELPEYHHLNAKTTCALLVSQWIPIDEQTVARRDAQRGIDQAAAHADVHHHGWTDRAFEFVKQFAEQMRGRGPFIGRDIVQASKLTQLPQPHDDKAWGKPIQRAARASVIRRTLDGKGTAPDPNRHGNPVPEWETA